MVTRGKREVREGEGERGGRMREWRKGVGERGKVGQREKKEDDDTGL